MSTFKRLAFCVAAVVLMSGQTPAPAPPAAPAAPAKPLRQLEYTFSVDYITNGEGHDSGMSGGGMGGNGSGVSSALGAGGRKGTMHVDVLGLTQDGGLVVTVHETLEFEPRPNESFTCTVYGDGHTLCPTATGPLSDAENVLLNFLGRGVIDPSLTGANNHWQRKYEGKEVAVVSDYTMTDPGNGKPVTIDKHTKISSNVRTIGNSVEDGRVVYDRSLSVPDSIHDVNFETRGSETMQTTVELNLKSDSFSKPN